MRADVRNVVVAPSSGGCGECQRGALRLSSKIGLVLLLPCPFFGAFWRSAVVFNRPVSIPLCALLVVGAMGLFSACDEDLTAVNQTWSLLGETWATTAVDAATLRDDLAAKAGSVPKLPASDLTGKGLQAALEKAMTDQAAVVESADKGLITVKANIAAAQAKKKVLPVQEAIKAARDQWTPLSAKLTAANTAATQAWGALKSHVDEEARKAAEKANNPANSLGSEVAFAITFGAKGDVDVSAGTNAAQLARLETMLATCESVSVKVKPPGVNNAERKKRREGLQTALMAKGVAATHFVDVDFEAEEKDGGEDVVVVVVVPCT